MVHTIVNTEEQVVQLLSKHVEKLAKESIAARKSFKIGVSGGSVAKYLNQGLPSITTEWEKWCVCFCDERMVSETDPDSTLKLYTEGLIKSTPLTVEQFIRVKTDLTAEEAAKDYEKQLRTLFPENNFPTFDLLLLGMGPDGHTASLFPGHSILQEQCKWITWLSDSPKPPSTRVTMTFPVINNSRCCVFAMAGEGKADMVKRILGDKDLLPAGRVKPCKGELLWILDKDAAAKL